MAKRLFGPDFQPPKRGQDKRTLILEAIKQAALLPLPPDATKADIERAFFARIAATALNDEHKDSGVCKQALLDRGWAKVKPEAVTVLFEYDKDATPADNAKSILEAASQGLMSIEDATKLMGAIKDTITIVESTELHDKVVKALEGMGKV